MKTQQFRAPKLTQKKFNHLHQRLDCSVRHFMHVKDSDDPDKVETSYNGGNFTCIAHPSRA